VKAADDLFLPVEVTPRDGFAKGEPFDLDAGLSQIQQVILRDGATQKPR
jgi:hypothetical protein